MTSLSHEDFGKLLEFRVALRRFQRWSEEQAHAAGLTHAQHQLLLAIEGHQGSWPPTVGDLARYLQLRPHSAVELIDRAALAGLVQRVPDPDDGRIVRAPSRSRHGCCDRRRSREARRPDCLQTA